MILIALVLVVSVTAYVWTCLLTKPGDIFDFVPALAHRYINSRLLRKVLFECTRCFAGQLALWSYVAVCWSEYSIRDHFLVVLFSIFCAHILSRIDNE